MISSIRCAVLTCIAIILLIGCQSGDYNSKLTTGKMVSLPATATGVHFTNTVKESAKRNSRYFDYFYNGSGVAIGDIDNDGLADIFFTGNDSPNILYKNKGQMQFEDITVTAGVSSRNRWATGVNMIDINEDGYLDIYVGYGGVSIDPSDKIDEFWINNGDGTFTNKIKELGLDFISNTMHTSFFDYDKDGDLDLWVNTHGNFNGKVLDYYKQVKNMPESQRTQITSKLFRNNDGIFTDVSFDAGIYDITFGLGLATTDLNNDGLLDVYVANDYFLQDYMYINQGNGKFVNELNQRVDHSSYFSMGCDVADINNDMIQDIVVVDMTPEDHVRNKRLMESMDTKQFNTLVNDFKFNRQYMYNSLQFGVSGGYFNEVGKAFGISQSDWSWAALLLDLDNDTYKDLYIGNGYLRDTKDNDFRALINEDKKKLSLMTEEMFREYLSKVPSQPIPNKIFRNQKGEGFEDLTYTWGEGTPTFSNGAAYADLDNDGDLDLVINNINKKASILENQLSNNNFIGVTLKNTNNPSGVFNSKIKIYTQGKSQEYEYYFSRGYLSSVDHRITAGIGDMTVDSIVINWLDGTNSLISKPEINTYHVYDKSTLQRLPNRVENEKSQFLNITAEVPDFSVFHRENVFDDFKREILLPHKYSTLGPAVGVADFNGDNKDDIFIGSSKGYFSKVLIQEGNKFVISSLDNSTDAEDIGTLIFDADKDGDLDIVAHTGGGGDYYQQPDLLHDRLYLNDGEGNFSEKNGAFPKTVIGSNMASVAIDIDNDQDSDIWVFGRNKPGEYPKKENSYLLRNNNGVFTDITPEALKNNLPGMITDAELIDYNNDGRQDILITSEWDKPMVLISLTDEPYFELNQVDALHSKKGWWQSITKGDFNGDGVTDYLLGNMGVNNKFQPSEKKPLGVMANDFDNSGTLDIVLTKKYKEKTVPVRGKECSTEQMPFLEAKFPTYSLFANSSIEEILGEESIEEATKMEVTSFESVILWGSSTGQFTSTPLPFMAQQAPLLDAAVVDINNDNIDDIILCGNIIDTEPETPSYDSGKGVIIIGNKEKNVTAEYNVTKTGLYFNNNSRHINTIRLAGGQNGLIYMPNNGPAQLYLDRP